MIDHAVGTEVIRKDGIRGVVANSYRNATKKYPDRYELFVLFDGGPGGYYYSTTGAKCYQPTEPRIKMLPPPAPVPEMVAIGLID